MQLRTVNVQKLSQGTFDVLIVGGGINGAVAAAALSARGCRVALVDRGDFGGFTSQASSNLVWGGIKYLENYEIPLVWDLCGSRNRLIGAYPANVREIRFYMAVERSFRWPPWMMWLGAWVYWFFGRGFTKPPRLLTRGVLGHDEPAVNAERFVGGVEYSDAYLVDNDSRFVFSFVRSALNAGAVAANYVEVTGASRTGDGLWNVDIVDGETGAASSVRSKVIINAAGPFADSLNTALGITTAHRHVFSKGIHLLVPRVTSHNRVLTFFDDTGRMFFVIPMGPCSVIGTTDTPVDSPYTTVTDEDRQFLLDNVNPRLNLPGPLTLKDIISERCGVRPLVVDADKNQAGQPWLQLSRKHVLDVGEQCLTMYGGKLTDCLNIGEETVEIVARMGITMEPESRWYGEPPDAAKAEFFRQARLMRLDELRDRQTHERLSTRLWRRYGLRAFALLEDIRREPGMDDVLIEGAEYLRCELHGAARTEMVTRLEDFLRRRSKIALVIPHEELRHSRGILEACRILFGDDAQRRYDEYFNADQAPRQQALGA